MAMIRMSLISGLECLRINFVAVQWLAIIITSERLGKHTFISITVRHLYVHQHEVEWSTVVACSL
jgi:hypothetical protein